jgi:hypothetical protein
MIKYNSKINNDNNLEMDEYLVESKEAGLNGPRVRDLNKRRGSRAFKLCNDLPIR